MDVGSPGDPDVDAPPPSSGHPPGEADGGWRGSLEHPLTAATSAMLNINAQDAEDAANGGHGQAPMTFNVYEYKTDKLGELWP